MYTVHRVIWIEGKWQEDGPVGLWMCSVDRLHFGDQPVSNPNVAVVVHYFHGDLCCSLQVQ